MALSPLARLLYIGVWLDADREGRLTWKPNTLKVRYLPGDQCDINQVSKELLDRGLIVLYGDGLAYIPTFLEHQVINPRESKSKIPSPDDVSSSRVSDASLRVSDAPSFHSLPIPSHSLPSEDRNRVQGQGAFTPGSLPRDHMFHAICGPRRRLCLSQTVYAGFARRYGDDEMLARVALTGWVEAVEREVGDGAIGDHLWLTKHFDAFLASVGRAPVAPPRPVEVKKPFSVQDALDREAARKAARL